jgi:5-methyltetrahydrofolate--homocysteine methyltransferase
VQDIIAGKKLRLCGIVGIFPANSVGDDIEVYADETRGEVGEVYSDEWGTASGPG